MTFRTLRQLAAWIAVAALPLAAGAEQRAGTLLNVSYDVWLAARG